MRKKDPKSSHDFSLSGPVAIQFKVFRPFVAENRFDEKTEHVIGNTDKIVTQMWHRLGMLAWINSVDAQAAEIVVQHVWTSRLGDS